MILSCSGRSGKTPENNTEPVIKVREEPPLKLIK